MTSLITGISVQDKNKRHSIINRSMFTLLVVLSFRRNPDCCLAVASAGLHRSIVHNFSRPCASAGGSEIHSASPGMPLLYSIESPIGLQRSVQVTRDISGFVQIHRSIHNSHSANGSQASRTHRKNTEPEEKPHLVILTKIIGSKSEPGPVGCAASPITTSTVLFGGSSTGLRCRFCLQRGANY